MKKLALFVTALFVTSPSLAETVSVCEDKEALNRALNGETTCVDRIDVDQLTEDVLLTFTVEEDGKASEMNIISTNDGRLAVVPPEMFNW